jgi:glutamate---cysteine ligase / carboxylate-amine ligase
LLRPFTNSEPLTFGVELEIQVVNTHDYDLTKAASDLLRLVKHETVSGDIKPETTESMIELSTGICTNHAQSMDQLRAMRDVLVSAADHLNVAVCGGGTHAFQHWADRQACSCSGGEGRGWEIDHRHEYGGSSGPPGR